MAQACRKTTKPFQAEGATMLPLHLPLYDAYCDAPLRLMNHTPPKTGRGITR